MQRTEESKKQILVVEDEGLIATDLQRRIERLGYSLPVVVYSGLEALRCARSVAFDLVLMDIRLRGAMDGIVAAQLLKDELELPVVFITALSDAETLNRARATEPLGYLRKPIADEELCIVLRSAFYT